MVVAKAKRSSGKPDKKPTIKTPTAKTAKIIENMKATASLVEVKTPADWPEGAVPNVRSFVPLPSGWRHAKKVTGASGKGSGGLLRSCFIGPGGKLIWNKPDLEKYLGKKIVAPPNAKRLRCMNPVHMSEFPPDAVVRRNSQKKAKEDYINTRCDAMAGLTVKDLLGKFKYKCYDGKTYDYNVSDLRYDLKRGNIVLEGAGRAGAKPKKNAATKTAATAATASARVRASGGMKVAPKASSASARARASGALKLAPKASSSSAARVGSKPPALPLPVSPARGPSDAGQRVAIARQIIKEYKARAASGKKAEKDICTLVGVGYQFKIDPMLLDTLPNILRKAPAERGDFGAGAITHFEKALPKGRQP